LGLGALPDSSVFAHAAAENRVLITFDLDFGDIAGSAAVGVLLLRLRSPRLSRMLERVRSAVGAAETALGAGATVLVEDARLRVRLPDST
jgi:predicted nuclease of predicted toxin-antitoxin system